MLVGHRPRLPRRYGSRRCHCSSIESFLLAFTPLGGHVKVFVIFLMVFRQRATAGPYLPLETTLTFEKTHLGPHPPTS